MSDVERQFHETWLGMVQPIDGLVVSIPVLIDAQCMERQPPHMQQKLFEICPATRQGEAGPEGFRITNLARFFEELLGLSAEQLDSGDAIPEDLSLYVPEGRQTLRPTLALKKQGDVSQPAGADTTPATIAGSKYDALVWEIPAGLDLDKPETTTGTWDYPPTAKFDRLLRHCRVSIGLLTNGETVRLLYAPHGESSGAITFRLDDMARVGGRPILDAFVMLLSANRFFGVTEERTLPALLAESRKRQANVTNELADQVFEALQVLLKGFESAAERGGRDLLEDALARGGDHLYRGLLTVLLRLVFVLYAEDRSLLPVEHPLYAQHFSLLALFDQLQADRGAFPDSMSRRFGAWGRLLTLFRAIYLGVSHGDLHMPPRHGSLFNPHEYPFLEGWGPDGSAPITQAEDRAAVKLPTVDDETVFRVLEKLLIFEGQRLSYRALDVEQIGSVYEALMGYHVLRVSSDAVCVKPDRIWVSAEEVLEVPAARRAKWLKETLGLSAAQSDKLNEDLKGASGKETNDVVLASLSKFAAGGKKSEPSLLKSRAGQLVLQPGMERRHTSSHYTPRTLSAPIVRRALEPLLAAMGQTPPSDRILNLKVCDPAMGSGAFLVEACRFLADHVVAAWGREAKIESISTEHGEPLLHARRLIAQRCLYGVDKNDAAVELAKLSLWLLTLSKKLPFTFLDHTLRHGDSLVGLDFDQVRSFHWRHAANPDSKQLSLFGREIAIALEEAVALRQRIGELGDSALDDREKARLLWDAQDALDRVRLIGDVLIGAFFMHGNDKNREAERADREGRVKAWLSAGGSPDDRLLAMQREIRRRVPTFHWMIEFPEIFYAERPDPLDENQINRAAFMDSFIGNPPFAGGVQITQEFDGVEYQVWLKSLFSEASGNADLCAYFFRRCFSLIGAHGTIGMLATNTICQGDTREAGLKPVLSQGGTIIDARKAFDWPGDAAVTVASVHIAVGTPARSAGAFILEGKSVDSINSRLGSGPERGNPNRLSSNEWLAFMGSGLRGAGFVLDPTERDELVARDSRNAERIAPFMGGREVNTSPTQAFERYVIDFGRDPLDVAERWPDLTAIVRERVKPTREVATDNGPGLHGKKYWWQHTLRSDSLYEAIAPLARCLITARVTKHLCFSFQDTNRVFSDKVYVFPFETYTAFCILQSRVHSIWTTLTSSTLGGETLNYSASDCFDTFPFPMANPRDHISSLEGAGQRLYDSRATYMVQESAGLTVTYNRLKDPACTDPRVSELRALHEEMDRTVIEAYAEGDPAGRWLELEVPPFCPHTEDEKNKLAAFEQAVIDRLFNLNAKRAEAEKIRGFATGGSKKKRSVNASKSAAKKPRGDKTKTGQLDLSSRKSDRES